MESFKKSPLAVGVAIVVVVAIIGGGIIAVTNHRSSLSGMNMSTDTLGAVAGDAVTIKGFAFAPAAVKVRVGSTVTWTNQDPVHHTVTVDTGGGPTSQLIGQGQSFSYKFAKAGTYTYHCTPHPYMHGTVVVTN